MLRPSRRRSAGQAAARSSRNRAGPPSPLAGLSGRACAQSTPGSQPVPGRWRRRGEALGGAGAHKAKRAFVLREPGTAANTKGPSNCPTPGIATLDGNASMCRAPASQGRKSGASRTLRWPPRPPTSVTHGPAGAPTLGHRTGFGELRKLHGREVRVAGARQGFVGP